MKVDLRQPMIHGSDKEQLALIRSYLYQLTEQLQWAFDNVESASQDNGSAVISGSSGGSAITVPGGSSGGSLGSSGITYDELKSLIVKTATEAEIVTAYVDSLSEGIGEALNIKETYVASSVFGEYKEEIENKINANSDSITQNYAHQEELILSLDESFKSASDSIKTLQDGQSEIEGRIDDAASEVESLKDNATSVAERLQLHDDGISNITQSGGLLDTLKKDVENQVNDVKNKTDEMNGMIQKEGDNIVCITASQATIKTGLLSNLNGIPSYGLEIGQTTERNGEVIFNKFCRLTSEGLYFFGASYNATLSDRENAVAYISDQKLYIGNAQITQTLRMGYFTDTVEPDGSIVTRWEVTAIGR